MWTTIPRRCPRLWTEYASGTGHRIPGSSTVRPRNLSVSACEVLRSTCSRHGPGFEEFNRNGVIKFLVSVPHMLHARHAVGSSLKWSRVPTPVAAFPCRGLRHVGARAVLTDDPEVSCGAWTSTRSKTGGIGGIIEGRVYERLGRIEADERELKDSGGVRPAVRTDLEETTGVVVTMLSSREDVYNNTVVPSRAECLDMPNGGLRYSKLVEEDEVRDGSEDRETTAVDVRTMALDAHSEPVGVKVEGLPDGGNNKRDIRRFQSEVVTGVTGRGRQKFLSQRKPLAGAEYRRRRTISDPSKFGGKGAIRQGSLREFTHDVHHAATETYLITRLAITLLKLLGVGTRWISKFIRLGLYALCLMPGFIQVGYFYYFDQRVHRSIIYGDQPRNRFDLYLPPEGDKPKPTVIFVTGGAWIIGYKAWGSLLAQQLLERDIIVACIDYRNFPQGCISDMVSDVSMGIGYVMQNIENYGGDPSTVFLAGQSAGAHLGACALLMQAKKEIIEDPAKLVWKTSQINAYMAISGGYNLVKLVDHFHKRGLYKSIFLSVMEGEESLPVYSPEYMVMSPSFMKAVPLLPPITLFHGTADYSIPHEASVAFAVALRLVGARVNTVLYPDKTHTDLFLQDPMRGGKDELLADVLAIVHANDKEARAEDAVAMSRRRLVPEILCNLPAVLVLFERRVDPLACHLKLL